MTHPSAHSDKSASGAASQASRDYPLVFEITRGRTASPLRPVSRDRYLIGAGERCDLRLGGSDMPAIHSIVHVDGDEIWMEMLADAPETKVNGRSTRLAALEPGDELVIGSFELTLHRVQAKEPAPTPRLHRASVEELVTDEDESVELSELEDLSAAELIEMIEHEQAGVEEFEGRRRMGARALLDAARQQAGSQESMPEQIASDEPKDVRELLQELQEAIASLNALARDFGARTKDFNRRDSQRVSTSLLDFQQQIVGRLDHVLGRIAMINERRNPSHRDVA